MKRLFLAVLIVVITQVAAPRGASEPPSTAPALLGAPFGGRETGGWTTGTGQTRALDAAVPSPVEGKQSLDDERRAATEGAKQRVWTSARKAVSPSRVVPAVIAVATGGAPISGTATWCAPTPRYCRAWGGNAHLGAMHSFHYGDKPYLVTVRHSGRKTTVLVVSFCACHGSSRNIDLSPAAFRELSPLSAGRINVTISRGASAPATYTEGGTP